MSSRADELLTIALAETLQLKAQVAELVQNWQACKEQNYILKRDNEAYKEFVAEVMIHRWR